MFVAVGLDIGVDQVMDGRSRLENVLTGACCGRPSKKEGGIGGGHVRWTV